VPAYPPGGDKNNKRLLYRREVGRSARFSVRPFEIADSDASAVERVDFSVEQVGESDGDRHDPDDGDNGQHNSSSHPRLQRMNDRHVPTSSSYQQADTE